jgi:hypothetical protein
MDDVSTVRSGHTFQPGHQQAQALPVLDEHGNLQQGA